MLTNKVRTYSVLKAQTLILPLHPLLLIHNVVRSPFIFSRFSQFSKVGFFGVGKALSLASFGQALAGATCKSVCLWGGLTGTAT